jgi:hypothetical protein
MRRLEHQVQLYPGITLGMRRITLHVHPEVLLQLHLHHRRMHLLLYLRPPLNRQHKEERLYQGFHRVPGAPCRGEVLWTLQNRLVKPK